MDIYASREQPVAGVTGERVAARVAAQHPNAHASGSIAQTVALLRQRVSGSRAVVIVFSAGDAPAVSTGLLAGGA
jgi:UDP-N-acetylmuramate-alanine ligase